MYFLSYTTYRESIVILQKLQESFFEFAQNLNVRVNKLQEELLFRRTSEINSTLLKNSDTACNAHL